MLKDLRDALKPLRRSAVAGATLAFAGASLASAGAAAVLSVAWAGRMGATPWAARLVGVVLVAGVVAAVVLATAYHRVRAADLVRLARWTQRLAPQLGDTVVSAVGLSLAPSLDGASPVLARAHIHHAAALLARPETAHHMQRARRREVRGYAWVAAVGAAALLACVAIYPSRVATGLAGAFAPWPSTKAGRHVALPPLWTDVAVTLHFPAYMDRPPQTLEGISGDFTAPRGTQVELTARADRRVTAARLLLSGRDVPLVVALQQALKGTFTVEQGGRYRVALTETNGDEVVEEEGHVVTLEADEFPSVELREPADDQVVQRDTSVPLVFAARDDHGLTEVNLVVRNLRGGEPTRVPQARPAADITEHQGHTTLELAMLGVRPGDRLVLSVEARDNDTVSGPKTGQSATRTLKVFSASEHHEELIIRQEALLGHMVVQLADEMETPLVLTLAKEPGRAEPEAQRWRKQVERGVAITGELENLAAAFEKDELAPLEVVRALRNMKTDLARPYEELNVLANEMVHQVQETARFPEPYAQRSLRLGRQAAGQLEGHILYLDDLVKRQRLQQARAAARELADTQARLRELLQKYKEAGDDQTRAEILKEMDALRRQLRELAQKLAMLQREMPQDYVNMDALADQDMGKPMEDVDRLMQEGDLEGALAALDRMAEETRRVLENIKDQEEGFGSQQYAELTEKLRKFAQEMDEVSAAQQSLLQQSNQTLEAARKRARDDLKMDVEKFAERLQKEAQALVKLLQTVGPRGLGQMERTQQEESETRAKETARALAARDFFQAQQSAEQLMGALDYLRLSLADRTEGPWAVTNRDTLHNRDKVDQAIPKVRALQEQLARLMPDPRKHMTPQEQQQMSENARRQGRLADRARQLTQDMDQLGQEAPIFGPEHRESLDGARREMQGAQASLGSGDLPGGRGRQQQALGKLQQLKQAMQEMGKGGGGKGGIPLPFAQSGEGRREGSGRGTEHDKVDIPAAEAFKVPQQFRKDILDAMKEGAPRSYESEVRRYYQELVK